MQLAARDQRPVCEYVLPVPELAEVYWIIEGVVCDVQIDVVKETLG